jgi:hypothetical protein
MDNTLKTLQIIEKHLRSQYSFLACIYIAQKLAPYYENLAWLEANFPSQVKETILHDYEGLKANDEHFLPRLA